MDTTDTNDIKSSLDDLIERLNGLQVNIKEDVEEGIIVKELKNLVSLMLNYVDEKKKESMPGDNEDYELRLEALENSVDLARLEVAAIKVKDLKFEKDTDSSNILIEDLKRSDTSINSKIDTLIAEDSRLRGLIALNLDPIKLEIENLKIEDSNLRIEMREEYIGINDRLADVEDDISELDVESTLEDIEALKAEDVRVKAEISTNNTEANNEIVRLNAELDTLENLDDTINSLKSTDTLISSKVTNNKINNDSAISALKAEDAILAADLEDIKVIIGDLPTDYPDASIDPTPGLMPIAKDTGYIDDGWVDPLYIEPPLGNEIGEMATEGFGVGTCPNVPDNFKALNGTNDKTSPEYGNYEYKDGSIMVWIPKFYFKISGNVIEIASGNKYSSTIEANDDGFTLHRAFIDGGMEQSGFFIDKYNISSKDSNIVSLPNYPALTLTSSPANFISLSKVRGNDFGVMSVYMASALTMLSWAHGQESINDTHCAWYDEDPLKNHPKGCNFGTTDFYDGTIRYFEKYTGSGVPFAKTTHNGQDCGVCDLNGPHYLYLVGMATHGSNGTSQLETNEIWMMKESSRIAEFNHVWGDVNCQFGTKADMITSSDSYIWNVMDGTSVINTGYLGKIKDEIEYPAYSFDLTGDSWLRTCCSYPNESNGMTGSRRYAIADFGMDKISLCREENCGWVMGGCAGELESMDGGGIFSRTLVSGRTNVTGYDYISTRFAMYLIYS